MTTKPKGKSLRAAINAKCKDCIYDPLAGFGTWRQQVGSCEIVKCPLWPVRPLSDDQKSILKAQQ